jgi:hypothetical protein
MSSSSEAWGQRCEGLDGARHDLPGESSDLQRLARLRGHRCRGLGTAFDLPDKSCDVRELLGLRGHYCRGSGTAFDLPTG